MPKRSLLPERQRDAAYVVDDSGLSADDVAAIHADLFGDDETDDEEPSESVSERNTAHRGGMVALLPDAATAAALAVDGGLDADELHLTLAYLGDDVTGWGEDERADLLAGIRGMGTFPPVEGRVLGRTVFNASTDPHTVYLVGDAEGLDSVRGTVRRHVDDRVGVPRQREPFVAHVTAGKGLDPDLLVADATLRFDRLVVALAGEWTEVPLGQDPAYVDIATEAAPTDGWTGWERDESTAAHYTTELLDAVDDAFDAEEIARAWLAHTPGVEAGPDGPVQELVGSPFYPVAAVALPAPALRTLAVRWLLGAPIDLRGVLTAMLTRLIIEAILIGVIAARDALVAAGSGPPADPPTGSGPGAGQDDDEWWNASINFGAWDVGDADAAEKVLGDAGLGDGLRELLAASDVALTGIADERMAEFARILAQGLAEGASVETLAVRLRAFQTDRVWARRTAITETARAISAATVDRYLDAGVEQHEWLVAGVDPTDKVRVCRLCQDNTDQGPVDIGAPFTSGAAFPPQHPNCRCALIPVVPDLVDVDVPDEAWIGGAFAVVETAAAAGDTAELDEANQLKDYWLRGKGLARWSTWTELYNLIRRHVPDSKAKRIAAQWFHDRYGYWPGDKRNREEAEQQGWKWSVEEARYVRSAKGAAHYKLPIGSLIKPNPRRTAPGAAAVARASGVVRPSGPGGVRGTATPGDLIIRKTLVRRVEKAEQVRPYDADPGSHIAAAMQRALVGRKPVWLHSSGGKTVISATPPPRGGAQFVARTDGSIWRRSFTRGGEERLQQVPDERVRALVAPHVGMGGQSIPRPKINPVVAARDPKALDDFELDEAMQAAITSEKLTAFDKLAAEADRRDAARDARQRRTEQAEQRKAEEFERLLTVGYSDDEAYARAYNVDPEKQARATALAKLRGEGYQGRTVEEAARGAFRDAVYERYMAAEDATNGFMLNPQAERKNVDPLDLFTGPEQTARANASEELLAHWDVAGRPTFDEFLAELMGDYAGAARQRNARSDFNQ